MAHNVKDGKQFMCGALFGLGAAHKMRGSNEWQTVTGVALPLID